ncbi:hypothetical protein RJT34_32559 [Clitoria ternatea]|uniref:pectinesterase n=1 Tax=Clitoria ternatea TaxID=43366 RepID=A0AAN9F0J2_CLITE
MGFLTRPLVFSLILLNDYFFSLSIAIDCGGKNIAYTITVNTLGNGAKFKTIQAAIDSISINNNRWVKIYINDGLYSEKVFIPPEKPCIILEGSGQPIISYGDHEAMDISATFSSFPPNVIAIGITFRNSFNTGQNYAYNSDNELISPAVAARIYGDKSFFLRCRFLGYQDTLFDVMGRHYFKDCYIQGEVDFICGNGQSYYENCTINANGKPELPPGYITAQHRNSSNDPGGFVFKGGSVIGVGKVNLGRAWGPYSRVIFYQTYFSSQILPEGWFAWDFVGHEENLTYAEVDCKGPGADTSKRVRWEKKLKRSDLHQYSLSSFINYDAWLDNLPPIS